MTAMVARQSGYFILLLLSIRTVQPAAF